MIPCVTPPNSIAVSAKSMEKTVLDIRLTALFKTVVLKAIASQMRELSRTSARSCSTLLFLKYWHPRQSGVVRLQDMGGFLWPWLRTKLL
ncbi:hypothetical protein V6N13_139819 [Hibiscus sabdariffa]|uniref:Uncharacterized protein n=2 Tax=Hibiscus sabdariffa TaxID=183260 RepID=A0ABR2A0L7_9ROSI